MSKPSTVEQVYALKLFEQATGAYVTTDLCVSGLGHDDMFSEMWNVLDHFKPKRQTDRTFYLLKHRVTGTEVLCRICIAHPDANYPLFCCIHDVCEPGDNSAVLTFLNWKGAL